MLTKIYEVIVILLFCYLDAVPGGGGGGLQPVQGTFGGGGYSAGVLGFQGSVGDSPTTRTCFHGLF